MVAYSILCRGAARLALFWMYQKVLTLFSLVVKVD